MERYPPQERQRMIENDQAPESCQSPLRRSCYARKHIVGLAQCMQLPLRSFGDGLRPAAYRASLRGNGGSLALRLLHQIMRFFNLRGSDRCVARWKLGGICLERHLEYT